MSKIAFIGLGNMGSPMAMNLLRAGHELCVFDLLPNADAELREAGAETANTALEAVSGVDFIISMLPASQHVESLYLGSVKMPGLLPSLNTDTVIIDSSTIDSTSAKYVHAEAAKCGVQMLDAPVSGGVAAAAAGTLSFMCGGNADTFTKAKPVLDAMGKNIFHAGGDGAGQVAKVCNNMLLSILMQGTSEAIKLGVDNGLDASILSEIMLASSGRNWTLECYNPCPGVMPAVPSSHQYQPGFMTKLMCKDLDLALAAAATSGSTIPMGILARDLYMRHARAGNDLKDFSSIFEMKN